MLMAKSILLSVCMVAMSIRVTESMHTFRSLTGRNCGMPLKLVISERGRYVHSKSGLGSASAVATA